MPPSNFPLRWESTGDQWWYASPIDWAAANGHYEVVRELLRLDSNHLMKLTSLRRIRRLETVWDDEAQFHDVAACRSQVARKLFLACDSRNRKNSLLEAGYGGWLIYTAASAGDSAFVRDLLDRNPLIVFGEGEYGVTDIFYAAARSKSSEVFWLVYDFAASPRFSSGLEEDVPEVYRLEMKNRAVHAAARGGNVRVLMELIGGCGVDDVLSFRDKNGSTVLHSAAGKGQVQVIKELVASYDIINSTDNQGNTALHIAAYRGQILAVDFLIDASPQLISVRNNSGDIFLHSAVSGCRAPAFERLDRHLNFLKHLLLSPGNRFYVEDIINAKNNEGQTVLHMAVAQNVDAGLIELLMSVISVNLNVRDESGMTVLDLLRQRPRSASSDFLIRRLLSAGGIFGSQDRDTTRAIASQIKSRGSIASPGRSFRVSDSEIFLHTGMEITNDAGVVLECEKLSSFSIEQLQNDFTDENQDASQIVSSSSHKHHNSVASAGERLKSAFHRTRTKEMKKAERIKEQESLQDTAPVPLRVRFSHVNSSASNPKRTLSVRSNCSIPTPKKKKLSPGLVQGVFQSIQGLNGSKRSRSSSLSGLSVNSCSSSTGSIDLKKKGVLVEADGDIAGSSSSNFQRYEENDAKPKRALKKQGSLNRRIRSNYFCFGSMAAKTPVMRRSDTLNVSVPIELIA